MAFADDKQSGLKRLVAEGYVRKDGDSYDLTPKGEEGIGRSWRRIKRSVKCPNPISPNACAAPGETYLSEPRLN